MSLSVFKHKGMKGVDVASRLSTPNGVVTAENADFYLKEPGQLHRQVGYMATQSRFVLWDIRLATLAKDFATEIPG